MICGGGRVGFYLAKQLLSLGMQVKIIEQDLKKCEALCESLPKATLFMEMQQIMIFDRGRYSGGGCTYFTYWYGRGEYHYGIVCKDAGRA